MGTIPGAEVGEVQGMGVYLTATYAQLGASPVALEVMAASKGNVTIVATLIDQPSQQNSVSGIYNWDLDFVLTQLSWPAS